MPCYVCTNNGNPRRAWYVRFILQEPGQPLLAGIGDLLRLREARLGAGAGAGAHGVEVTGVRVRGFGRRRGLGPRGLGRRLRLRQRWRADAADVAAAERFGRQDGGRTRVHGVSFVLPVSRENRELRRRQCVMNIYVSLALRSWRLGSSGVRSRTSLVGRRGNGEASKLPPAL